MVKTYSTKDLRGTRVVRKKGSHDDKRVGKVSRFVFHPTKRTCIGFLVKRPDAALMFHRRDIFVAVDGFTMSDGRVMISEDPAACDSAACKRLGVNWDDCVFWQGLTVMTESGTPYGLVGEVVFDAQTGDVVSFVLDKGKSNEVIVGTTTVPADYILGFKRGIGTALSIPQDESEQDDPQNRGALLVTEDIAHLEVEGGAADKAGRMTAVAVDKAKTAGSDAKDKIAEATEKAKPKVQEAGKAAEKVINKGAFETGRQISKTKTMFSDFKSEFDKAIKADDESDA